MKKPFNPPTVKHDVTVTPTLIENTRGDMVEGAIVHITGPGLPGIDYPYKDPSEPDVLKRYCLTDLFNGPIKPPEKLWGNYWHSGQLCILAGDMGTGKSTLAIRLARGLAEGGGFPHPGPLGVEMTHPVTPLACHPSREGILKDPATQQGGAETPTDAAVSTVSFGKGELNKGKKVLFIGFELGAADMRMRYGSGEVPENFFYANISADAFAAGRATLGERLVESVEEMVAETEAEVVIIDQPDRMHLQPAMWNYLMLKLNALKAQKGISILITLNNKPRNLSKTPTVSSLYKSNLLAPHADSIVALANHCRQEGKRYLKLLKNTALPLGENTLVEVLEIGLQNNEILLQPCGTEREEKVLLPTATERRNALMMEAEEMRYSGMGFRDIAQQMELPERTVRSWVGFVGSPHPSPLGVEMTHPVTPLACHPSREGILKDPATQQGGAETPTDATVSTVSFGKGELQKNKEGSEPRHQGSLGERGGGFGFLQQEHITTPSLTTNGVSTPTDAAVSTVTSPLVTDVTFPSPRVERGGDAPPAQEPG